MREHVRHVPIVVESVHDVTSLPNAEATGLGPSRRVVLWDTLVSEFTPREVTVVIAHELGHLAHNHIWKDVGWYALLAFPGAFLVARVTRRFPPTSCLKLNSMASALPVGSKLEIRRSPTLASNRV